jgi:N6-L-threonylcarbamoyladenine synthase
LLVGVGIAKAMAYAIGRPLVGVHHLAAHIFAVYLEHPWIEPPFLALVVSGGHTALYQVLEGNTFKLLGETRDDAAGEAFDKVAKCLDLGYPGGPIIDKVAREGNPNAVAFPRALSSKDSLEFSFSGLKTAVRLHLRDQCLMPLSKGEMSDLAASFQEAVVDVLVDKTERAAIGCGIDRVVISGGVACNGRLRERMREMGEKSALEILFPSPVLCTDNAAMVARAGLEELNRAGNHLDLEMNARSRWPL